MTPDEVQGMIDTSIEEYDVEIQVDLEDLSERISGNTEDIAALSATTSGIAASLEAISGSMKETFYFDVASYFAMGYEDRRAYWDMVYAKVNQGAQIYAVGASDYASSMTAIIPLVKYKAETDPSTHAGGWLYFSAKAPMYNNDTNLYFSFAASSVGDINGLNASGQFVSQSVYNLPVASDSTLGGVKVGSGLSIDENGVLSASGIAGDISTLSGTVSDIRSDVNTLSGTTNNIQSDVETLSGKTADVYDAIFYEDEGETYSQIDDLWDAVEGKQDALEAGDGISLDSPTISVNAGKGLYFKEDGKMEVLLGPGLRYSGSTNALAAKIGEGLGFSGDTLVVSGISGGGDSWLWIEWEEYNAMEQEDKEAVYDSLLAKLDSGDANFGIRQFEGDGQGGWADCIRYYFDTLATDEGENQWLQFSATQTWPYDDENPVKLWGRVVKMYRGDELESQDAENYGYASKYSYGVVKIGSNINVDSAGTISVSANNNYSIANSRPASSSEGKTTFVRTSTEVIEGIIITFTDDVTDKFVGGIYIEGDEGDWLEPVYYGDSQWHWTWEYDAWDTLTYHTNEREGEYYTYATIKHNPDTYGENAFSFFPLDSGTEFRFYNGDYDATEFSETGDTTYDLVHYGKTYVWINSAWTLTGFIRYTELAGMSNEERADFFQEIKNTADAGRNFRILYDKSNEYWDVMLEYRNYEPDGTEHNGQYDEWLEFYAEHSNTARQLWLGLNTGFMEGITWSIVNVDFNMPLGGVDSGGTNSSDLDNYLDYDAQSNLYRYGLRFPNPDNPDEYLGIGLLKWWYKYKIEWQDSEEGWRWYYVVGADVPIGTTIYSGVWGWYDNEHIETLSWTSGATYESQTYPKYVPSE